MNMQHQQYLRLVNQCINISLVKGYSTGIKANIIRHQRALPTKSLGTINLTISCHGHPTAKFLLYSGGNNYSNCINNQQPARNHSTWTAFSPKLTGFNITNGKNHQQEQSTIRLLPKRTSLISQKYDYSKVSRRAMLIDNVEVDQDTKLYVLTSYSTYFRRTILSGFGALICLYGCVYMWTLDLLPFLAQEIDPFPFMINNRIILSISFGLFGIVAHAANKYFIWRTISFIQLKAGGQRVEIRALSRIPFSHNQYTFEVPLKHISCVQSRDMPLPFVRIKIKDKIGSYYIDKEGFFPDPILFDSTIGVARRVK